MQYTLTAPGLSGRDRVSNSDIFMPCSPALMQPNGSSGLHLALQSGLSKAIPAIWENCHIR